MVRRGRSCAALATAVALVLASCGGDDDELTKDDKTDTSTTLDDATTTTSEPEASPEEQALQVYRDGQAYFSQALGVNPPNPEDPALFNYFSGSAMGEVSRILLDARQNNEYAQNTSTVSPEVVSATGSEVVLRDCLEEIETRFDGTTGQPKGDGRTVFNFLVRVLKTDAGWRVDEITPQEESCTP